VFGLTTELIVGTAPPEKAGAASGISETAAELGGALGIAILGSVGVAIYRSQLAADLPAGLPTPAADAAKDTLGGAVVVSSTLPPAEGSAVFDAAANAFVTGLQVVSAVATVIAVLIAVVSWFALRQPRLDADGASGADGAASPADEAGASASSGRAGDSVPAATDRATPRGSDDRLCCADC
jgi:DHA2 family multidrug resistance protein-like MFS transporter